MRLLWLRCPMRIKPVSVTRFLLCAGFVLGLYAAFVEPFMLRISEQTIATQKWDGRENLKIALVGDIHIIRPWMTPAHLEKIVRRVNQLEPDIILVLGDYVGTHPFGLQVAAEEGLAPLKALAAPCGVFAVLGNHDFHGGMRWPQALIATGIPVLQNESRQVTCHGDVFHVAGLEELWMQNASIEKALSGVTGPVILMMHNPDSFVNVPAGVTLSVAGHMHGGQVRFPLIGAVTAVLPSKYGRRYLYGHITEDGKDLFVTSGLGMTGLPIRFLTPPEIAVVTLTGAD
jgi:uncharacterized protein